MSTKINDTIHLKNFIDAVNKADNSRQKTITIDIEHGKRVRNALTNLLLIMTELQNQPSPAQSQQDVNMDGGNF